MKLVGIVIAFIAGLVICYLGISLGIVSTNEIAPKAVSEPGLSMPTYLSFVSVLLTTVTVVLASVAIGIGIVAAYTFSEIKNEAQNTASKTAQKKVDEALSDDVIRARIDEISFGHIQSRSMEELEAGFDPTDSGDR